MRAACLPSLAAVLLVTACASTTLVELPPRVDLRPYGQVGLVTFSSNTRESLAERATRRFAEQVLQGQLGVEVLEI